MLNANINTLSYSIFPILSIWIGIFILYLFYREYFILKSSKRQIIKNYWFLIFYYFLYLFLSLFFTNSFFELVNYIFVYTVLILLLIFILNNVYRLNKEKKINIYNLPVYLYISVFIFPIIMFFSNNFNEIFGQDSFWLFFMYDILAIFFMLINTIFDILLFINKKFVSKKFNEKSIT